VAQTARVLACRPAAAKWFCGETAAVVTGDRGEGADIIGISGKLDVSQSAAALRSIGKTCVIRMRRFLHLGSISYG